MNPYEKFDGDMLTLRDELAIDRTLLANERTLLAWLRSGVALILAGVTFIHFAQGAWLGAIGCLCVPVGVIIMILGFSRYKSMDRQIANVREEMAKDAPPLEGAE
jgi:putative membrane protein